MNQAEAQPTLSQRRKHERFELDSQLTAAITGVKEAGVMRGRSLDISQAGIAGVFAAGWDVGTIVNLEFVVPLKSTPFSVIAIVRNRNYYRYGFEFVGLSPGQQEMIFRTCRTLALLQSGTSPDNNVC